MLKEVAETVKGQKRDTERETWKQNCAIFILFVRLNCAEPEVAGVMCWSISWPGSILEKCQENTQGWFWASHLTYGKK